MIQQGPKHRLRCRQRRQWRSGPIRRSSSCRSQLAEAAKANSTRRRPRATLCELLGRQLLILSQILISWPLALPVQSLGRRLRRLLLSARLIKQLSGRAALQSRSGIARVAWLGLAQPLVAGEGQRSRSRPRHACRRRRHRPRRVTAHPPSLKGQHRRRLRRRDALRATSSMRRIVPVECFHYVCLR